VGRNSVDYLTTYWQPPPGLVASIDLNGSGSVSAGDATVRLHWDVPKQQNTVADMKWTLVVFDFTATDTTTALAFKSSTPGVCGPAIGGVSVTSDLAAYELGTARTAPDFAAMLSGLQQ